MKKKNLQNAVKGITEQTAAVLAQNFEQLRKEDDAAKKATPTPKQE